MNELTIKDKTILLAKHFGWKFVSSEKYDLVIMSPDGFEVEWAKANGRTMQQVLDDSWYAIPRYFEDSAAIRKAKLSLTDDQKLAFVHGLCLILGVGKHYSVMTTGYRTYSMGAKNVFAISTATPEQEAEALGLILGLWES